MARKINILSGIVSWLRHWREDWRQLRSNPIILRELRYRMRNRRSWINITLYTLILGAVGLFQFATTSSKPYSFYSYRSSYSSIFASSQEPGFQYFLFVVSFQLLMICLGATTYSDSLAQEKATHTYDVLLVTLLQPRDIIRGHFWASLLYLWWFTIAGLPVISIAFVLGGVTVGLMLLGLGVLCLTSLLVVSVGGLWAARAATLNMAQRKTFQTLAAILIFLPLSLVIFLGILDNAYQPYHSLVDGGGWVSEIFTTLFSFNPFYVLWSTSQTLHDHVGNNLFLFNNGSYISPTPFLRALILLPLASFFCYRQAISYVRPQQVETAKQTAMQLIYRKTGRLPATPNSSQKDAAIMAIRQKTNRH